MARQEASTADAELGVVFAGEDTLDQLDAGPHATRILPAAAGPSQPFAENRAGGDQTAILFVERSGERPDLAGGAHADADQAGQQSG